MNLRKKGGLRRIASVAVLCTLALSALFSIAEDIDLFVRPPGNATANTRPNILFIIDNSSNWSAANQQWPGGIKQGQAELRAMRQVVSELGEGVNAGLMMMTDGGPDGGYVRFHVRQMTAANKAALRELIGDETCVDGPNSLNGTPNCIYKNFNGSEKVAVGQTKYSGAMFEAFKYFGGYTDPANARTDVAGTPLGREYFGPQRYAGGPHPFADPAAYADASKAVHQPPLAAENSCGKSYIVFIGNGFPTQDAPAQLLTNVRGSTTQLPMPTESGTSVFPAQSRVNYADEWAKYLYTTDVGSAMGQQNVTTFTIDAYNAQQDMDETLLLRSMAKHGGGRYFAASSEQEILDAMRQIAIDIQAVSSVFTAASLPVGASNRTQYLNEVYFGLFRPDAEAQPRWHGNLKRYRLGFRNGEVLLVDRGGQEAISDVTGQLHACAASYWSSESGAYWDFSPESAGLCTTAGSPFSDLPDGPNAEKGGAGQVIRRGNNPSAPVLGYTFTRDVLTCGSLGTCGSLVTFNTTNVSQLAVGALTPAEHQSIVDHARGIDVGDENGNGNRTETRPSLHGDVVHSGALPVNYGGSTGVVLYYGANNGALRAVSGDSGRELWAFVAPEHYAKLKRLMTNSPLVAYPGMSTGLTPLPIKKDYFFDGTAGLYQNVDNSKVWIFPTMRRGGRMIYAFDVTTPGSPRVMWRVGCPDETTDIGCTAGFSQIGQTWSLPNVARIKGHDSGASPVIVVGGGYDKCEDEDALAPACSVLTSKGRRVYVLDAQSGSKLAEFTTDRSVPADVTLVDRNADGMVDHAYVADTGGSLYRIDFSDPGTLSALPAANWSITAVARTQGAGRKFLFAPAVFATKNRVYLAIGSGDRERPLITNYPFVNNVRNRLYMFVDTLAPGLAVDLDGTELENFSAASTTCGTALSSTSRGWYMDLSGGRGEQVVGSPTIFGGVIYANTNRPLPAPSGVCAANLGEARGYAVNLINASGAVGTDAICGGVRSGVLIGGGLPASPVAGLVNIEGKPTSVVIGGVQRDGGPSAIMNAQKIKMSTTPPRTREYWYTHGNR